MGGPVAKFLIRRHQLAEEIPYNQRDDETPPGLETDVAPFEYPRKTRLITASNAVTTLGMFAFCIYAANWMTDISAGQWFELPTFVWALATGVLLRNILENVFKVNILIGLLMYLAMLHYLFFWQLLCYHFNSGYWQIWQAPWL